MESFLINRHREDRSMRGKRFKTEQVIKILKESELGITAAEICRKRGLPMAVRTG
jgi:hypothetical protein